MYRGLTIAWLLCSFGCECGEPSPPTPDETEPTPVPEPEPELEPEADVEERAPMVDPARADEVRAAIREGRVAARGERWDEALAAFDRAMRILPGAPRVRCEAGYVAHRAGRDRRAARDLDLALALLPHPDLASVPEDLRVPLAMCLYNRGLVHEALEEPWRAARRYEESLALRPHPAVQARLDVLGELEARRDDGLGPEVDVAGLRALLATTHCDESCDDYDDYENEEVAEDAEAACSEVADSVSADHPWPNDVAIFELSSLGCLVRFEYSIVALRTESGWALFELDGGETSTTDSFYRTELMYSITTRVERLGEHLLRFDLRATDASRYGDDVRAPEGVSEEDDPGCLADHYDSTERHDVVLCRTDGVAPRCGVLGVGRLSETSRTVMCERSEDTPEWAEDDDGSSEEGPLVDRLELRFEDGAIAIALGAAAEALPNEPAPGRYELDALFERVLRPVREYRR